VLLFVFAGILYILPPHPASVPEVSRIVITSLMIEPARDEGGFKLYRDGSQVVLRARNAVRKEIWYMPKGTETADLSKMIYQDFSTADEIKFPLAGKNLVGEIWAKAYDSLGGSVETERVNISYDESSISDEIQVTSPKPDDLVKSPLRISGKARGSWFFEASFPVTLLDDNNEILARIALQAKGDWMTSDFVDFENMLSFSKPETDVGSLLFENDNPSGLPENAKSFSIPIRFK